MIVFEIIVYGVLEHLTCLCKAGVADLCARYIKVSAALESFKDELNVYTALGASRNDNVVIKTDEGEGCFNASDVKKVVSNL